MSRPPNESPAPEPVGPSAEDQVLELLARGDLDVVGRLVDASNATLLAQVCLDGVTRRCVYKPVAGERPLWDFPRGTLARREVAAYLLSAAAGWHLVPATVLRDGPHGTGSVQLWVEGGLVGGGVVDVCAPADLPDGWISVLEAEGFDGTALVLAHADDAELAGMALFDVVVNNADRKVSHVLREPTSGLLLGVDHGLTFNLEPKLRTVLWGWAGARIGDPELARLGRLATDLRDPGVARSLAGQLAALVSEAEVEQTRHRVERLLATRRFPRPTPGRYPAIPWPPV